MHQFRNPAVVLWIDGSAILPSAAADEAPSTAALMAEVRQTFTLGKRIPPKIFRDFGDGDWPTPGASGSRWI